MFGMAASAAPTKEPDMVPTPSVKPASVENPTTSASQADEFRQFLESIWPKADAAGVSRATFDNAISGLTPDSAVLEKSANQADFTITIAQYLTQSVSAEGGARPRSCREPFGPARKNPGAQRRAVRNPGRFLGS